MIDYLGMNQSIREGLSRSLAISYLDYATNAKVLALTSSMVTHGSDKWTLAGNGLTNGDKVKFLLPAGGSLPAGVTESTEYYVVGVSGDDFQVSLTSGGTAIALTSNGGNHHLVKLSTDINFNARNRGANFGATGDTYASAVPTKTGNATTETWAVYEFLDPTYCDILADQDCAIVHLPSDYLERDFIKLVSDSQVASYVGNTAVTKTVPQIEYPEVATLSTRITNDAFSVGNGMILKRFAVLSNTATAVRIAIRAKADNICVLLCKN